LTEVGWAGQMGKMRRTAGRETEAQRGKRKRRRGTPRLRWEECRNGEKEQTLEGTGDC